MANRCQKCRTTASRHHKKERLRHFSSQMINLLIIRGDSRSPQGTLSMLRQRKRKLFCLDLLITLTNSKSDIALDTQEFILERPMIVRCTGVTRNLTKEAISPIRLKKAT